MNEDFEMQKFYEIRKNTFNIDNEANFNIITIMSPDNFEKNIILANVIGNETDKVPEENIKDYYDIDRTSGVVVSMSSIIPNLLFIEI